MGETVINKDALFLARHMLNTADSAVGSIESQHREAIACAERLIVALGTKEEFQRLLAEKAAKLLGFTLDKNSGTSLLSAMGERCNHFDNLSMRPRGKPFERYKQEREE